MTILQVRDLLLWCTIINFGMLALWGLLLLTPHAWLYRIWRRWLRLTDEQFDMINFQGLVLYKMLVLIFNAVPLIALYIVV